MVDAKTCLLSVLLTGCGPGNVPYDYPPPPLMDLGLHQAPTYVARDLMPIRGIALVLAHPRLGQPAIRRAGEVIDVEWISPQLADQPATISLDDGTWLADGAGTCDGDGICHLSVSLPDFAPGLYGICVAVGGQQACSPHAIAIVTTYNDPATIVHVSDAHIGYDDAATTFANVIASIDAIGQTGPTPDFAIFTGDAADSGLDDQRAVFLQEIAELNIPVFIVTGNHDYDATGIDGHLLDVGPELDMQAMYGGLQLVGVSSGQDLDDGNHDTTISESNGPDSSELTWLATVLTPDAPPTIAFFHHPIYNGTLATIGPCSRDALKALVTHDNVRAVLSGHIHATGVFDADGNSRGLSLDADTVPSARWPLHYIASRASRAPGGYAILHVGTSRVDYRWIELP
ncbi:MAG TPA: metallophosphoesterase [Kofleriaceae bacterium]|nr:metallophosphoesterase [Kofleriaceae bacterium]